MIVDRYFGIILGKFATQWQVISDKSRAGNLWSNSPIVFLKSLKREH